MPHIGKVGTLREKLGDALGVFVEPDRQNTEEADLSSYVKVLPDRHSKRVHDFVYQSDSFVC